MTDAPLFVNVAALLDGKMPEPPARVVGTRTDGEALFYAGQVNWLFGDPESGKTFLAHACAAEAMGRGNRVAVLDLDHNGPHATLTRLVKLGAPLDALRDPATFRYVEPEDMTHLVAVVRALREWEPAVAIVDSIGELLPCLGLSSNNPDDFTKAHSIVLKPLAMAGAAVIAIDHLAKNSESRTSGPTGTTAKRRAVGGVSLRAAVKEPFTPGQGGRATLTVNKDRHGALRAVCPTPDGAGEVYAGTFVLIEQGQVTDWRIYAPSTKATQNTDADADALRLLDPPPTSKRDVMKRMSWGSDRAQAALTAWKERWSLVLPHGVGSQDHPPQWSSDLRTTGQNPLSEWSSEETHRRSHGDHPRTSTCEGCHEPMVVLNPQDHFHPNCGGQDQ